MKATHVGNYEGKRLYFIFEEPPSKGDNGAMLAPDGQVTYFPFWSFVSRKENVEPIKRNKFQRFLWDGHKSSKSNLWNGIFIEELIPVSKDLISDSQVITEFPNPGKEKAREKSLRGSDFRRLVSSGNGDAYAIKRLRGRIGRATRMATGGARGFVRGAVFNPNAADADGDGFVQEGTQFARPATARVERAVRGFASRVRAEKAPRYKPKTMKELSNLGLLPKTRDPSNTKRFARDLWQRLKYRGDRSKIHKASIDKMLKRFLDEYGNIKTHKDAFEMWEKLAPGISIEYKNDFIEGNTEPLSASAKGMHLGYMMGYLLNKERFDQIDFGLKSDPNPMGGGATEWSLPISMKEKYFADGYNIKGYKPRLRFQMSSNDLDSVAGTLMDGVTTQIPVSMSRTEDGFDLSEFPSIREAFGSNPSDVSNAMYNFLIGLHETGHAAHNMASMEDRGLIGKRRRDVANDAIKALSNPDIYREVIDNEMFKMMALSSQRVLIANSIWLQGQQNAGVDPMAAMNNLMANPMKPMDDFIAGAKEFFESDAWKSLLVDADGNEKRLTPQMLANVLSTFPEAVLQQHEHLLETIMEQAMANAIQQPGASILLRQPNGGQAVASVISVPVSEIGDNIIKTLEDARTITAQIINGFKDRDPNRQAFLESLLTGYQVIGARQIVSQDVIPRGSSMRRLKDAMIRNARNQPAMVAFKKDRLAKYQNVDIDKMLDDEDSARELLDLLASVELSDRRKYGMDKLTEEQVALIWDISRQISEYASYDQHSLYGFAGGAVIPTEMIAEMLPALLVDPEGYFQNLSAPELEALTKLVTWIYGPEFAQTLLAPLAPQPKNPNPEGPKE